MQRDEVPRETRCAPMGIGVGQSIAMVIERDRS
jgi:hypothetical protein